MSDCPHPGWVSHAGWLRCEVCGEQMPRYGSVAETIDAARQALRGKRIKREEHADADADAR